MAYQDRITIDPRVRSGKACIKGTRIAVVDVLDYLGGGMTVAEMERQLIFETLAHCGQNRTKAAELLDISVRTLRNKLKEYGAASAEDE